ncbi:MAG: trypsin-like peptidase domain-containing protein [Planctomycetes bacterium]|nr:trypsin-like peptidase domain-containing protein [Planctomycetota bacterium]
MSTQRLGISPGTGSFLVLLALVGLAVFLGSRLVAPRGLHATDATPRLVEARGDLASDERAQIELFRAAAPSVVHITTRSLAFDRFSMRATELPSGTGSGFAWDERGYVVTNYHVVAGARSAFVTLASKEAYEAQLVGADPSYDVAVLKIDAPRGALLPVPLGVSRDLLVGQKAFAIGNPFGLDHTLSTGVVSGLDREITAPDGSTIRGVIQTDAAINPGNSGGPLLDSAGRLIGMNTAIASPSGASAGIGFAVPVDTINRIVPRLIRGQIAAPPRLGVRAAPGEVARLLGVDGVVVAGVERGLGAEAAGLRPLQFDSRGRPVAVDVIRRVAGVEVRSIGDLHEVLSGFQPGDTVDVDLVSDGRERRVRVRLTGGA